MYMYLLCTPAYVIRDKETVMMSIVFICYKELPLHEFYGLHSYSKMHTVNLYSLNSMLLRCCLTLGQVPGVAHCTR